MSSENKEKEEELKERNRRIQKTINEMDAVNLFESNEPAIFKMA